MILGVRVTCGTVTRVVTPMAAARHRTRSARISMDLSMGGQIAVAQGEWFESAVHTFSSSRSSAGGAAKSGFLGGPHGPPKRA